MRSPLNFLAEYPGVLPNGEHEDLIDLFSDITEYRKHGS
jgi:hypothetical protein